MEAQNILYGFCSNLTIPSIHNTSKSILARVSPSSTSPHVQTHKWISQKACLYLPLRVSSRKKVLCATSARKPTHVAFSEDSRTGIRKKKLAVFVSGGGSNFHSIHEASLRGSVHGEIVVLVTNRSGTVVISLLKKEECKLKLKT